MEEIYFNVLKIERGTTVDGPGFRTSIYLAGCRHQCPGCHNPQSWDFSAGKQMKLSEIIEIIQEEEFNVTLTGGDPLFQPKKISLLISEIVALGFSVWIYTGFSWEEIQTNSVLKNAVCQAEAIVEGKFIESLRNPDLKFRGSSNQRIIYL